MSQTMSNQQNPECRDAFIAAMEACGADLDLTYQHLDDVASPWWNDSHAADAFIGFCGAWQTIADRPLDDDLNVLIGRCERREPLSLAEQRELWLWLEERDMIIGDQDEDIQWLRANRDAAKEQSDTRQITLSELVAKETELAKRFQAGVGSSEAVKEQDDDDS